MKDLKTGLAEVMPMILLLIVNLFNNRSL